MKEVILTNSNLVAWVDDSDFELVNKRNWRASFSHGNVYATTGCSAAPYNDFTGMHNLILGVKGIDHIDHNGLNNQRSNLRPATHAQQMQNKRSKTTGGSGFKGVTRRAERGTWRAQIRVDGRLVIIGTFHNAVEAALAYDKAAKKYFGEYAGLNFPI